MIGYVFLEFRTFVYRFWTAQESELKNGVAVAAIHDLNPIGEAKDTQIEELSKTFYARSYDAGSNCVVESLRYLALELTDQEIVAEIITNARHKKENRQPLGLAGGLPVKNRFGGGSTRLGELLAAALL